MAAKEIVFPVMSKHLLLAALQNYRQLVNRRMNAEVFDNVKREQAAHLAEVDKLLAQVQVA